MGREILRVPLDFDWPIGKIWPGRMLSICSHMEYIVRQDKDVDQCALCRKWAVMAGFLQPEEDCCPKIPWRDPPEGEAYQLWSTTTEGHPMSPPFETPEELAQWLVDNKISSFGYSTCTYEEWLRFIKGPGWAPSGIMMGGKIMSGVEAIGHMERGENSNEE